MYKFDLKNPAGLSHQIQLICLIFFLVFSNFSVSLTQIFGFAGAGIWIIQTAKNRAWRNVNWTLALPFSIFLLACLLSSATAADPWTSFRSTHKFLIVVIFFWAGNIISHLNPKDLFLWRHGNEGSTPDSNFILRGIDRETRARRGRGCRLPSATPSRSCSGS